MNRQFHYLLTEILDMGKIIEQNKMITQ